MVKQIMSEFSFRTRRENFGRLAEHFDILVVGGGITGAGIARDAAMRGFRTVLIDKNDFASGTSSKSSKLVHGGVRYLELFEFGLVFEASRERRTLWRIAPDYVRPLPFLFPVYRDARWPAWMIDIGLWMYDGLSLFRNFKRHKMHSNAQIKQMLPGIDVGNINGGALYYDAQVDDARLTLESIRAAHRNGAVIVNYAEVDSLLKDAKTGRVNGVKVHDTLTGDICHIHSHVVVNATGPWTDTLLQLDDPNAPRRLRPTKGVHILVPKAKLGGDTAVAFPAASDGRLMFVIPWGQFTIVGTTDTDFDGNYDTVHADAADVDYVIAAVNHAFPESRITKPDIISAYAGLRPLVLQQGRSATKTSREHEIWTTDSGLVTIAGGKLTTYRSMAEELTDLVSKRLREEFSVVPQHPCETARVSLVEPNGVDDGAGVPGDILEHLVHAHGPQYPHVLELAKRDPSLSKRMVDGLPYLWAEVDYAVQREMAQTTVDVLDRRMHILNEASDGGLGVAERVAQRLGDLMGSSKEQISADLDKFQRHVGMARAFRA